MIIPIYPTEFHLNKANSSDTEAPFLNSKFLPFFDGDVPRLPVLWCIYFAAYTFCKCVLMLMNSIIETYF